MRRAVSYAIVALHNGFRNSVFVFDKSAVLTFACDVETLISKLCVYDLSYFVRLLLVLGSCISTFAKLTIFAFL